ncbi:hypothetical protein GCM10010252_40080 [Streptomyces aureoverticillatus]|nr:hypothetical protein GCM10010252_40080 [Streptomyces aureoverticillatus]
MRGLKPVDPQAPEDMRELAERLRLRLDRAGFTGVRDVAASCDLSRSTISEALSGSRAPTWTTVSKLLRCCRMSPDADWRRLQERAKAAEVEWRRRTRDGLAAARSAPAPGAPGSRSPQAHVPAQAQVPAAPSPAPSAVPGTFTVRAPYGELPPRVRGRDELMAGLRHALTEDRERIQVLHGVGGCGKTTVALGLARHAKDLGYQVFWLSAATQDGLVTGMRQVARVLAVPEPQIEDAWAGKSSAMDLVWRALDGAEQPWLLVVDNVDEPGRTASRYGSPGDGTGWIRPSGAGLTVVTTRIGNPSVWGGEATCRPVGVLSADDGAEVLVDFAGNAGPMEDARALARRLGGMPLALKLAGSYLARAGRGAGLLRRHATGDVQLRDFAGYARELDRLGTGLLDRGAGGAPEAAAGQDGDQRRYRRLISSTWEISLDLLAEQGLPEARLLMRLISCFAHAPLPAFLLDLDVLEKSGLFPETARADRCETALEGLVDLGLLSVEDITFSRGGDGEEPAAEILPCLTVHLLVHEANALRVQEATGPERERVWRAAAAVARFVSRIDPRTPEMWKLWKVVLPHVEAGIRAVPCAETEALATFLWAGAQAHSYAISSNSRDTRRELARLLLERATELPHGHPTEEHLRRILAEGVETVGDVYRSARAKHGEQDPQTLSARAFWAHELWRAGQLDEAEREYDATLRTLRDAGVELWGGLTIQAQYVQVLADAGKSEAAQAEARALLSALEAGHKDGDDVAVRHHVAHALEEAGLLPEAERTHRDQLAKLEKAGEQDSVLYLDTSSLLCGNLVRQRRHTEALAVVDVLLARYRSVPEPLSAVGRNVVKLYQQRAQLLVEEGRFTEATADLECVLDGLLAHLPPQHSMVIGTRFRLVRTLLECGRHDAAVDELDALDAVLASSGSGDAEAERHRHTSLLWRARASCVGGSCATAVTAYEELLSAADQDSRIARLAREEAEACRSSTAGRPDKDGPSRGK